MDTLIISLLCGSILLFIVSFFQKDKTKQLEKEVEELGLTVLKEHYQLKKRMKVLEEELLIEESLMGIEPKVAGQEINEILKSQVLSLYSQGVNLKQISSQSSLSLDTVKKIIAAK